MVGASATVGLSARPSGFSLPCSPGVAASPSPEQLSGKRQVSRAGEGPPRRASQGAHPPKDQTWPQLHPSPTATLAGTRRGREVGGPRSPSSSLAAVSQCSRTASGRGWGLARTCSGATSLLEPGPWGASPVPCSLPAGAIGREGTPVPTAATGTGGHPHVGGAAWGQASAPSISSAGGATAARVSGQLCCPLSGCGLRSHEAGGPGGSAGEVRGGLLPGARAHSCLPRGGWSSAPCPARLPAVGHGARSWLERRSQPRQVRLRQGLQTG